MTSKIIYSILLVSMLPYACERKQKQQVLYQNAPKVVEARGYVVPKDSMAEPKVVPAGKTTVVRLGKPNVVPTNTNVRPAGIPRVVTAGIGKVCTPGLDSFSLPKTVLAIDSPFMAGIPEVVIAKEAYTKVQNPQNFSSFGKLQGLRSGNIFCLLEDKIGNLWMATPGGGVSKYDGKSFTNFTKKEGLSDNTVRIMLEDKSGNLWFGSNLAGVTKYEGRSFTHFTINEGLSDNKVHDILEDKNGNLWFGTQGGGINRYDGNSFTHFTMKEGLINNGVYCILEDKGGNLWVGTDGGVSQYNGKSFINFTKKDGLCSNKILSILEDQRGYLWFGTDSGVNKYDGKTFTHFTDKEGLIDNNVCCIEQDKIGNLWFGTYYGGVSKYDGKNFIHFTDKEGLTSNYVRSILEDKRGNLWIGTGGGGVSKYSGKTFTHFTVTEGLSDNNVKGVLEDRSGNLWVGTWRGGVSKYDGKSLTHLTKKEGLNSDAVVCMLEDKRGNLWFGNYWGVSKYDGKSFTYFTDTPGLNSVDVFCMMEDKSGNLWFGTYGGGVSKYDGRSFTYFAEKEGLSNNNVLCMLQDKNGDLWFGTHGGGINKYDGKSFTHFTEKEGLTDNDVRSMLEDKSGNLWVGSLKGGVSKYNGKSFTHFTEKEGLINNDVRSIWEDKKGNLWFGTFLGLSKLEKDKLSTYDKVAVNAGRSLQESKQLFKNYAFEDGFSGIEVNFGKTIYEDKDGTIWIGTIDKLTAFHPGEETSDTIPPNMQLTGITLFNENIAWQNLMSYPQGSGGKTHVKDTSIVLGNGVLVHDLQFNDVSKWNGVPEHLSLAYNNNYLTFQFVGITLQSPKKVKYKYKLEGLDEYWSALTERSEAPYGNLPHGRYTFKVKAMNGDGYWSKELNYSFIIRPPWWQTWWFRTGAVLSLLALFYGLVKWRLHQKFRLQLDRAEKEKQVAEMAMKTAELQQQTTELEMQALRAQMNPHFIFNCLSSINMFILENNRLQASDYLSKFSRLVRLILQNSQEAFIPLERELETLRLYLELESLRFEQRFEYKINVSEEVDITTVKVPPLIIQPYAENAIWHGLMPKKEKGRLEIELFTQDGSLFCKIVDDGIGRKTAEDLKSKSASDHKSIGMQITANRMKILQSSNGSESPVIIHDLVAADGSAAGTEVIIKMPMIDD